MGVQIEQQWVMVDSVTGFTFGPTFDHQAQAESFLAFCAERGVEDVREPSESEFEKLVSDWMDSVAAVSGYSSPMPTDLPGYWDQS